MRKIQLAAIVSILIISLFSCANKPDNKVYATNSEVAGYHPENGKVVTDYKETALIKPTWGQAAHFAHKRGDHALVVIIGFILLIAFAAAIYGRSTDAKWFPNVPDILYQPMLFVLLAGAVAALFGQTCAIKWNNDKFVSKQQVEQAIKETGSTQPVWDSLESGCHIVDGPYGCFKK